LQGTTGIFKYNCGYLWSLKCNCANCLLFLSSTEKVFTSIGQFHHQFYSFIYPVARVHLSFIQPIHCLIATALR